MLECLWMGLWRSEKVYVLPLLALCKMPTISCLFSSTAIEDLIRSTNFTGDLHIMFETTAASVSIRPDTSLSRALSNTWVIVLLWITLIYPFIWLFRRFSKHGGGKWEVCGAAYSLKSPPVMMQDGSQMDRGMKEGAWFKQWSNTILNATRSKTVDSKPLVYRAEASQVLDGYNDRI